MNEHSPFPISHGPVIDAELSPPPEQDQDLKQVSVSQIGKYPGWSQPASDCLEKTTRLAEQFNHGTVGIAHLVLAMTLVPSAVRQLQLRNIDIDSAFRSAMMALIDMERVKPGDPVAKTSSSELNSMPPDAPAARHIRGGSTPDALPALRAELEAFASRIEAGIRNAVPPVQQPVIDFQMRQDIAEIKSVLVAMAAELKSANTDPIQPQAPGGNENTPQPPAEEEKTWRIDIPWMKRA